MDPVPYAGPSVTYLDPDGDLRLEVGPERTAFMVDSRALARASLVWKRMLFGGFAESRPANGPWVVSFPEDEPQALRLLLAIIHADFSTFKTPSSLDELFSLTVTTNKYDISHVLKPWALDWAMKSRTFPLSGNTTLEACVLKIWISWELGRPDMFKEYVQELLLVVKVNEDGTLVDESGKPLEQNEFISSIGILGM